MKPQRKIKVTTRRADSVTQRTDMLVVGAFSQRQTIAPALRPLDRALAGALSQLYKIGDFTGDGDTQATLYSNGMIPAQRILLCGLGDRSKVTLTTLRKCAAAAAGKAVSLGVSSISVALHTGMPKSMDCSEVGRVIAEGVCHGAYRYEEYMTALGQHQAGLMSDDDDLLKALKHAADQSGEPVWHLPSGAEYARDMESKVADLKNAGATRWGGASTAAAFLRQFADQTPWAHLDIAGMDVFNDGSETTTPGSSGFGVRLLCAFLTHMAQR